MESETQSGSEELQNSRCSFVWDENSQLYFHSSSGFYHDPVAGWYYSSRDGSYYKFENGSYVLLQMNEQDEECKTYPDDPVKGEPCRQVCISGSEDHSSFEASEIDTSNCKGSVGDGLPLEVAEGIGGHEHENPPTSLWLEDTLIDLFLSGYSNSEVIATNDSISPTPSTTNHGYSDTQMMEGEPFQDDNRSIVNSNKRVLDGGYDDTQRMEGERLQDENHTILNPNESVLLDEGVSTDEDNWRAQYGQVTNYGEAIPKLSVMDIWDWSTVMESRTGGKGKVMRLVGRLVRKSAKLHPSVSSNGALLKTAPVCEVHLDLVRVATGKIYKLHNPSKKYLTSMSTFDSSNPTKDWGFPDLLDRPTDLTNNEAKVASTGTVSMSASTLVDNLSVTVKGSSQNQYRDRAAERRVLHGGFGVGPGQKNSATDHGDLTSSPPYGYSESSPAEALNISFGEGSYARKILITMGWKEGEGLGNSMKGMVEPLQAVGNIGNAGLGWPQGTKKLDI
ncbi:SUPPRESSOR OF ABI3-5 isoform X4 [Cucurbita moschata]|uniref:SUPPRESSOR OF ABI3-5 isoform X4 n=1 Tax=Cucurbita moschata TaxID=3662 RepID=A0A6J1E1H5_CUCMO|nr:SUPPRESSOR OF ABI3-5 isoform X4 [Cucurbita moschata]